ncbi:exodeoxyribonuclease VII large subunit [Virgibacillus litoralis]|uniref:Exodeoxyribonuclease 7 large subunit n=1 Tax=Virgibacillus litoralis TaxID=578221 RepID=A0ABS4HHR5_9BACI|nr:exodeoxyribonuclease VII large subunit [Virgibacillus litoralis]
MKDNYLTVTALTKYIKRKFDTDSHLKNIWLKGEISNFKHHSRGHMYLTIKDDNTRIQAVMFAGNNRTLKFTPENGMNVLIKGEIGVFEPYGQYQLYIQQMEPDGIGSLYLAFEQLKEKLHKQGFFDKSHKKELPRFPKSIGVITSPTGAAVRDIVTTIERRYPIVKTTVIPVLVQGPNAVQSIYNAINSANQQGGFDVLIVGRGGGSIEDLWSFNEEKVANAIFQSSIPVISAVGHETDITISDYVADLRAPTPTGAAEVAVPSQLELTDRINGMQRSLTRMMNENVLSSKQHLNRIKQSYAFRYPEHLITQKEQELDKHVERLEKTFNSEWKKKKDALININTRFEAQHPERQIERARKELKLFIKQTNYLMDKIVEQKSTSLNSAIEKLSLLNPLETMKRGYAIPYAQKGNIINSIYGVSENDQIDVKLSDGTLECRVLDVKEENNG